MNNEAQPQTKLPAEILLKRWARQNPDHVVSPAILALLDDLISARLECDRNLEYTRKEVAEALAAATVEEMEDRLNSLLKWCGPVATVL